MPRVFACYLLSVSLLGCAGQHSTAASGPAESHPAAAVEQSQADAQVWLARTAPEAMAVLRYWFEEWDEDRTSGGRGRYNDKWFPHGPKGAAGSKAVDDEIRKLFLGTFERAVAGELNWDIDANPFENLAYIILIDQFSRNMFRGQDRAYAHDALALEAARHNVDVQFYDYYLTGYQKLFVVYPLMHHENLVSQRQCVAYLKVINEHPDHQYEFLNAFDKGMEHYQMILMFGRFPHRNERHGRPDTKLEAAYLAKKGMPGFVDGALW
jgi:uncharacterized protein (DUF924 family)